MPAEEVAEGRSEAAREASRRNGAKSQGPRTVAGKQRAAKNAIKHGLRARQAIVPQDLPEWIHQKVAELQVGLGHIGQRRRELLDRYIVNLMLVEQADRLTYAEVARLFRSDEEDGTMLNVSATDLDLKMLRRLVAYGKRFRVTRDNCLLKLAAYGPRQGQKAEDD